MGERLTQEIIRSLTSREKRPLAELRLNLATSWADIKAQLPDDYNPHWTRFLRDYFRAQLRVARGQRTKAQRIFDGLDRRTGYKEFEEQNREWLAAIDLAVRGDNRRNIEPAFRFKDS